jgi:hypothetical protein
MAAFAPALTLRLQSNNRYDDFCPPELSRVVPPQQFSEAIQSLNRIMNSHGSMCRFFCFPFLILAFGFFSAIMAAIEGIYFLPGVVFAISLLFFFICSLRYKRDRSQVR